jgi:hypothetical protein
MYHGSRTSWWQECVEERRERKREREEPGITFKSMLPEPTSFS